MNSRQSGKVKMLKLAPFQSLMNFRYMCGGGVGPIEQGAVIGQSARVVGADEWKG